tara:strand:+ start:1215 stop:1448 length:234 start_codon:yes stop_codon:yes gene_type:complete
MKIQKNILQFICQLAKNKKINKNTKLISSNLIDSMSVIEIISFVEKKYNVTFKQNELSIKNLNTVGKIETFIKKKLK